MTQGKDRLAAIEALMKDGYTRGQAKSMTFWMSMPFTSMVDVAKSAQTRHLPPQNPTTPKTAAAAEQQYVFNPYPKTPRLGAVTCTITEKIDGTNGQLVINKDGTILACSRNRILATILADGTHTSHGTDNFGFAAWAIENQTMLRRLGPGNHYGEWAGLGIGRRYNKERKHFVLFNVDRYESTHPGEQLPSCVELAPVLYRGPLTQDIVEGLSVRLLTAGSCWAPGFMRPEGLVVRTGGKVQKVVLDK